MVITRHRMWYVVEQRKGRLQVESDSERKKRSTRVRTVGARRATPLDYYNGPGPLGARQVNQEKSFLPSGSGTRL